MKTCRGDFLALFPKLGGETGLTCGYDPMTEWSIDDEVLQFQVFPELDYQEWLFSHCFW